MTRPRDLPPWVEPLDEPGHAPGDELDPATLELVFSAEIWHWRGPAPHHFVTVPPDAAATLHAISSLVTYGWGMIPVRLRTEQSAWDTSLFPKDGGYIVPIKTVVRRAEELAPGDTITVRLTIRS